MASHQDIGSPGSSILGALLYAVIAILVIVLTLGGALMLASKDKKRH